MALFAKKTAAISTTPVDVDVQAAVGFAPGYSSQNTGVNMIGQYYTYQEGEARNRAISVPAINRARDLMASVISCMPLKMYNEVWNEMEEEMTKVYLAPRSWLRRPDPTVPYGHIMAWTFDDLFFYGRAFWYITSRTADGYPASFTRFLVQFLSPTQGLIYSAPGAIETALKIEAARNRNASSSIPAGILKQTDGEPLSAQELTDIAAQFNAARATNQTAALNQYLNYEPTTMTPDKMLLIESANYSALEAARLGNVPPYLVGVSTGSYSYQSAQQARADLYIFGVKLYAEAIAATLSMDNVLPRGTYVAFDSREYLEEEYGADKMDEPSEVNIEENTQERIANR
jgi:hypothetical protein